MQEANDCNSCIQPSMYKYLLKSYKKGMFMDRNNMLYNLFSI